MRIKIRPTIKHRTMRIAAKDLMLVRRKVLNFPQNFINGVLAWSLPSGPSIAFATAGKTERNSWEFN